MTTWQQYVNRRKVDVGSWMRSNNISDYEGLVTVCAGRGVKPPPKCDVEMYFIEVKKSQGSQDNPAPVVAKDEIQNQVTTSVTDEVPAIDGVPEKPSRSIGKGYSDRNPAMDDPADLGIYDVDNSGFLVVKQHTKDNPDKSDVEKVSSEE